MPLFFRVKPARASIPHMAEDLYSPDYQQCRNSAYLQAWRCLRDCEEKLCRADPHDSFGPRIYSSLGGMAEGWGLSSRIARVRDALDHAQPQAWQQISDSFSTLTLGSIWPILISLASDIALYVGGGAASGAALGAAAGFFFGGIGAIPGALAGASIGSSAGLGLLNWIGIASLAKDLAQAIPQAIGCYIDGIKTAWGPEPERDWRSGGFSQLSATAHGSDSHLVFQASHQIAQGHVILIGAILMAIMAYVTKGKGDKAALLTEMRNSPRLGPKMADWVQVNEAQFPQAMAAMESRAAGKVGGTQAKAAGEAQTPSQAAGKTKEIKEEPKAEKPIALTKSRFGHTFTTHGQDVTDFATKRAAGMGKPVGQFLDNQAAARLIQENLDKLNNGAISIPLPKDFPARMIMPDGTYLPASAIRIVPGGNGVKTAYPEL
jgi:hypothetical protein